MNGNLRVWTSRLAVLGVFVAGALTGAFAAAGYVHHRLSELHTGGPHAWHAMGVGWVSQRLDLDAAQRAGLEDILRRAHVELFRFKSEHNEQLCGIVMPALEEIDALLTTEQRELWRPTRDAIEQHARRTVEQHGEK